MSEVWVNDGPVKIEVIFNIKINVVTLFSAFQLRDMKLNMTMEL